MPKYSDHEIVSNICQIYIKLRCQNLAHLASPNFTSIFAMAKKAEKPIEKMKKVKDSPIVAPEIVLEKPSSVVEELANSDSGEEDEGIDEEGMAKLMKALGEDGLDEVGQLQLKALNGEQEDDESEDEDEDNGGSDVPQEEGSERETNEGEVDSEEEENGLVNGADEERIALEDVESIDEDAIPQQKVVTDNKV